MQLNFPLESLNTFHIAAYTRFYAEFSSVSQLKNRLMMAQKPICIIGGGSNILFTQNFEGTLLKNKIEGIHISEETPEHIILKVGGGVVWHDLVRWCVERNYGGGIENLSLIPGTVGAAPIQNIGAYGVEFKDIGIAVEVFDLESNELILWSKKDCEFGYRDSIFKQKYKNKYCITHVFLQLIKNPTKFYTEYGAIRETLSERGFDKPSPQNISDTIIFIRNTKLPDPRVLGNAGSFFKNPSVSIERWHELKKIFPLMQGYFQNDQTVKIAAAWLIDYLGWKGRRCGDAGVHTKQALVLVNHANASGKEILALAQQIQASVSVLFGISLQVEVAIL